MPVCVQMRPQGIPLLHDILKKFPNSIVIIDHFARSVFDDGAPYQKASDLWGLAKFSGVHLKLTHRTLEAALVGNSNHEDFFRHVLRFFSADRIAWGSNFPAAERPLSTLLAEARAAISHLDQSDQDLILGGVAKSLFPSLQ
jgi:predicted TIM-barrel fold metal-dependent hydrolase